MATCTQTCHLLWAVIIAYLNISMVLSYDVSTLRLVQILWRHGDRSPVHTFPTDPHQEDAWPQGWGQLSQIGMMQHYKLGQFFRQRYAESGFMNETYSRFEIHVRSTYFDRTIMSAQSNLAGWFPPEGRQVWNPSIPWQPIPIEVTENQYDPAYLLPFPCPRYDQEMERLWRTDPMVKKDAIENKEFYKKLSNWTGVPNENISVAWTVADALFCERQHNYSAPSWLTETVYQKIRAATKLWVFPKSDAIKKLNGGVLVGEKVENMKAKLNGSLDARKRVFVYSAHDSTVAAYLNALSIWNKLAPPYASSIMTELHETGPKKYIVRVFYRNDSTVEPYPMKLPGCELDCPFDDFVRLTKDVIPKDMKKECQLDSIFNLSTNTIIAIAAGCSGLIFLVLLIGIGCACYKRGKSTVPYKRAFQQDSLNA